jgi:drug/metabolite transporter (DMT)-like permease
VIGLALGDAALFRALLLIGPRKTMLIFASSPIITSIIGWGLLREILSLQSWVAIAITIAGIVFVISERSGTGFKIKKGNTKIGIVIALLAALGQSVGLILSKIGMADHVDPLPATLLRIFSGMLVLYTYMFINKKTNLIAKSLTNGKALLFVFGGSVFGPFAGVWLSVTAVRYTETGIASTLMSMVPIMILPAAMVIYKERLTLRTIIGTVIAVSGIAMLFLR